MRIRAHRRKRLHRLRPATAGTALRTGSRRPGRRLLTTALNEFVNRTTATGAVLQKKHIAILYPYNYLPYSPTVVNLYDELAKRCKVTILCTHPKADKSGRLGSRSLVSISYDNRADRALYLLLRALRMAGLETDYADLSANELTQLRSTRRILKAIGVDEIIAVDTMMLWVAQKAFRGPVHLLSLELAQTTGFDMVDKSRVESVVIQSGTRLDYLFPDRKPRAFFVPVSPVYRAITKPPTEPGSLLFCGSTLVHFGIYTCVHLLSRFPDFNLTVKGRIDSELPKNLVIAHSDVLESGRLELDSDYVAEEDMPEYVAGFRIGLCFYDTRFRGRDNFHIQHVPSQKYYRYIASGVPVVASNLPGLKEVEEHGTGILIDTLSADAIRDAIAAIEQDYDRYVENCFKAAEYFSFDRHVRPFVDFLSAPRQVGGDPPSAGTGSSRG